MRLLQKPIVLFCVCFLFQSYLSGQQLEPSPQLLGIYPTGGQVGTEFDLKIVEEVELEIADSLQFSHPGITATPIKKEKSEVYPNGKVLRNQFRVSIKDNVPPGVYKVRAECAYGLSNTRTFVVTKGNHILESEPNNELEKANEIQIGSTVHGLFESGFDTFFFEANAKQPLTIVCKSAVIDSRGDPVLTLQDSNGKTISKVNCASKNSSAILSYTTQAAGKYFVKVNDLIYASTGGANVMPYQLSVTTSPWIDFIDPPFAKSGTTQKFTLYGRNIGGKPSSFKRDGITLESRQVDISLPKVGVPSTSELFFDPFQTAVNFHSYKLKSDRGESNPINIALFDAELKKEIEPNDLLTAAQALSLPAQIIGAFGSQGDVDQYTFDAKKGESINIQVHSDKVGLPTDVYLSLIRIQADNNGNDRSREMKNSDDLKPLPSPYRARIESSDPELQYVIPSDGKYCIKLNDQFNADPSNQPMSYLLSVTKKSTTPNIRLLAIPGLKRGQNENNQQQISPTQFIVRKGASTEIQFIAYRNGFEGEIRIEAKNLPAGVACVPTLIPSSSNLGALILSADTTVKKSDHDFVVEATAMAGERKVSIPIQFAEIARVGNNNNALTEMRSGNDIKLSIDDTIEFPGSIKLETENLKIARGGKLELAPQFIKQGKFDSDIQQVYTYGLPPEISKNTINLTKDGKAGKVNLDIRENCKPGTYAIFMRGFAEFNVPRFEKAFKDITEEQRRLVKLQSTTRSNVGRLQRELQQAQRSRQSLEQQMRSASSNISKSKLTIETYEKSLAKSVAKIKTEDAQLKKITQTSGMLQDKINTTNDPKEKEQFSRELNSIKSNIAAIQSRIRTESQTKTRTESQLKTQNTALANGENALKKLETQVSELAKKSKKLKADHQQQSALQRELDIERRSIDQDLGKLRQAAQPRRRRFYVHSQTVLLEVVDTPFQLSLDKTAIDLNIGEEMEITAKLARELEFDGDVAFSIRPPQGTGGWKLSGNTKLQKNSTELKFKFATERYAKPGNFEGNVIANYRYGNRNMTYQIPITVSLSKVVEK